MYQKPRRLLQSYWKVFFARSSRIGKEKRKKLLAISLPLLSPPVGRKGLQPPNMCNWVPSAHKSHPILKHQYKLPPDRQPCSTDAGFLRAGKAAVYRGQRDLTVTYKKRSGLWGQNPFPSLLPQGLLILLYCTKRPQPRCCSVGRPRVGHSCSATSAEIRVSSLLLHHIKCVC